MASASPERHHGGGEVVAVLVDQALAVAEQEALPLQALVEELGVDGVAARQPRRWRSRCRPGRSMSMPAAAAVSRDPVLAADQDRGAEVLVDEGERRADDLLLLAFREHHALREAAHPLEDAVERAGDRVAPGRELRPVGPHVDDRAPGDARVHGGLRHRRRDRVDQARVEGDGDDVVPAEAGPRALVGRRDLVRHVLAGELGQGLRRRDLHLHVDGGGAHVERPAEDVGEAEHVVDLVRVVGAAGRDDGVVADQRHLLRRDLRVRVRHGEDDRLRRPWSGSSRA